MSWHLEVGDCREILPTMPDESVDCVVTSPPYWGLRDYLCRGQIGLEASVDEWVSELVNVFDHVRRVLRDDGTLWLNLGDCYDAKRLVGAPWRVAFALQQAGWWLRSDIVWAKPNAMPESVTDRPIRSHEFVFLLAKSAKYYYDAEAVRTPIADKTRSTYGHTRRASLAEDLGVKSARLAATMPERKPRVDDAGEPVGASLRDVWEIAPEPYSGLHFATYPTRLAETCIKAGCPPDGIVLDPFAGVGTTLLVAERLGRDSIGIELNPEYVALAKKRLMNADPFEATDVGSDGHRQRSLFEGSDR